MSPPTAQAETIADATPFVSVVVPVYEDLDGLRRCLLALERQTYPASRFEVLVVDNGSSRDMTAVVAAAAQARLLHEPRRGSYAARNRGLAVARGAVVAFTDADCVPAPDWLARGVQRLLAVPDAGLVAGRVEIFPRDERRPSAVEVYESVRAFPQRTYVERLHYGATANVFTRRAVLELVGPFDPALLSRGDFEWGQRVRAAGLGAVYADDVVVRHPARVTWRDLRAKLRRVVEGERRLREARGYSTGAFLGDVVRGLLPPLGDARHALRDERLAGRRTAQFVLAVFFVRYVLTWERLLAGLRPRGVTHSTPEVTEGTTAGSLSASMHDDRLPT